MYAKRFPGMRYAIANRNLWSRTCPYNMRHVEIDNINAFKSKLGFEKWYKIGLQTRLRTNAKPYRLYWRLIAKNSKYAQENEPYYV